MRDSTLLTAAVPIVGNDDGPGPIWQAPPDKAMRVAIRNVGGTVVFLAHDIADLQNVANTGAGFQLNASDTVTIYLAPSQRLVGASQGGPGMLSIAASEAIPQPEDLR